MKHKHGNNCIWFTSFSRFQSGSPKLYFATTTVDWDETPDSFRSFLVRVAGFKRWLNLTCNQGRVKDVYILDDIYVSVNNAINLCIYRPKWRCTVTLVLAFFVPIMLVATQSYKPLSAGVKFLMVSVPWFTTTLPVGKGIPTLLQVTVGRGKPSAWQVTWKVLFCTGAACGGGTLMNTGRPEIIIMKKKCGISYQNNLGQRWHLGKSSLGNRKHCKLP